MAETRKKWAWVQNAVVILMLAVAGMIWFGRAQIMGTKLPITDKEAVHYSGTATEQEARALGEFLKSAGFFNGESERDVLLNKGEEGTVVSFVVESGKWNDPDIVADFESVGRLCAPSVGGPPITVKLLDNHLNTEKTLPIAVAEVKHKVSENEIVRYESPSFTEDQAKALGEGLREARYFDGTKTAEVLVRAPGGGKELTFIVDDDVWDDERVVEALEDITRIVAPAIGGLPITMVLADPTLKPHKTVTVEAVTEGTAAAGDRPSRLVATAPGR